ncbi:MAG TPA: PAS domain S-box protein [Pyrinomonadaceae bacterium]|jgi:PAS domain S-box-containing protein
MPSGPPTIDLPDDKSTTNSLAELPSSELAQYWLTAIIESADDAIVTKTLEGIITSWNKGAERIFGYTAEEVIGKPVTILIPADHQDEEPAILARLRAGKRIEHYETVRVRKDGTFVDISLTVSPIRSPDGRIIGASKIARDISERKRAEEALRQREEELTDFIENSAVGLHWVGPDGTILWANKAELELLGYTREEYIGHHISEFHADSEVIDDILGRLKRDETLHSYEARLRCKDGSLRHVLISSNVRRQNGEFHHTRCFTRDITERRLAEQALRQSEERFAKAFQASPLALTITSLKTSRLLEVNETFSRMSGFTREEAVGRTTPELGLWVRDSDREEEVAMVSERGGVRDLEYHFRLKDGTERVGLLSAERIEIGGEPCALTVIQDITEQKRAEAERDQVLEREKALRAKAEEASRLKDEFLATVSHELRTPLTSILGWAHMLRTGQFAGGDSAKALETIERNARAQSQLIDDLLDVSRIITGKLRLDIRVVDPNSFIEAAIEAVKPAAEAKGIRVQKIMDTGVVSVSGDPVRLQQVVWNLLSNAIKFTPKDGRVQIRLERVNSHVEIAVSDNGSGIAPEFLPHVFDRFRQADQRTTRQHGGMGLGLAIVRHLVELHGGTVRAESAGLGQGSTFTVLLPVAPVYQRMGMEERVHPAARDTLPSYECPDRLDGLRVLVVDDEPDTLELLKAGLGQCGAEVVTVRSAGEALEAMATVVPGVLISDIGMPDEDGYDLIRRVRQLPAESGGRVPAIALTAYARTEDRMQALKAGYQMHVPKPVELAELVAVVASLVRRNG